MSVSAEDKAQAIETIEHSKNTHVEWLEHLDACPACPDARVAGDKSHQVKAIAGYNQVLSVLREEADRAEFLENELRARRECFVGARQDIETVIKTIENAESMELARTAVLPQMTTRLELLELAIRQVDEAIS